MTTPSAVLRLLTRVVADAVADGLIARAGSADGEEKPSADRPGGEVGSEEPLAEWERELAESRTATQPETPPRVPQPRVPRHEAAATEAAPAESAPAGSDTAESAPAEATRRGGQPGPRRRRDRPARSTAPRRSRASR